ncbi:MAG: metallophosphoesterase family protein [Deltaproteobacteria bacterium]|nr:metallophosphoesterase family protein [Deltaproteobacteria bacterium]
MRIIAFGDIHERTENIEKIKDLSRADCVIITGDLTNVGGIDKAKLVLENVRRHNSNLHAQAGNFDQKKVQDYLTELNINIHANGFLIENVGIFGVGGSNYTPFNTPIEYSEEEIKNFIYQGFTKVNYAALKIFVTHAPPFNTSVDVVAGGRHVGSKAVRSFIEEHQPQVCITGHIHEAAGHDTIGQTMIINPGMLKNGGYVEILIDSKGIKAELKRI